MATLATLSVSQAPIFSSDAAARFQALARAAASRQSQGTENHRRGHAAARRVLLGDACGRGCSIRANYQSTTVHLPPALATGNLDIVTDAMVREITLDTSGLATGVNFIDRTSGNERHAGARVIVLAASACETVRILLNSKSRASFPTGLRTPAARSATTSWTRSAAAFAARCRCSRACRRTTRMAPAEARCIRPGGFYQEQLAGKFGFARGYHIEFGGGRRMPGIPGRCAGSRMFTGGSYGRKLKEDARRYYGSFVGFDGPRRNDPQ